MKRYFKFLFASIFFTLIFCSCHHNDAGDMYQNFPIQAELETESRQLDWVALTSEQRQEYKRGNYVIDSKEDFPDENLMGLEKIKSMNIDFDKYTLLLSYNLIPGIVEGHRYVWSKNLQEGVFELWMDFKVSHPDDDDTTLNGGAEEDDWQSKEEFIVTYYCTALLVNKIPANSKVVFWR